jgi:hypothetical protein
MNCHELKEEWNQDNIYSEDRVNCFSCNNCVPDIGLRAAINKVLDRRALADITIDDLESLTDTLDARDYRIKSIEGIQYARNISCLLLQHNAITDITPLSSLSNLEYLSVNYNHIREFPCMLNMYQLKKIYFSFNHIIDISPLIRIPNLFSIYGVNQRIKLRPLTISDRNDVNISLEALYDNNSEFILNECSINPFGIWDDVYHRLVYPKVNVNDNICFSFEKKYQHCYTKRIFLLSGIVDATVVSK